MKRLQSKLMILAALLGILGGVLAYSPVGVSAASPKEEICTGAGGEWKGGVCNTDGNRDGRTLGGFVKAIVNVLLFIIGAIAVIMIVVGGIKYTTSNGDSAGITSAKNTILYAVVGLVIALMAYAIVNFVLGQF